MTSAEKRYFKMHYGAKANTLTLLFDLLAKERDYDESRLKAKLDSKQAANLKVYKAQLTDLLLKCLVSYQHKKDLKSKIRIGLQEVDILIDKGISNLAISKLRRLKQLCIEYQEYTYLIEIIYKEFYLGIIEYDKIGMHENPLFQGIEKALIHLEKYHKISMLGHEFNDWTRRKAHVNDPNEKAYLESILNSELLKDKSNLSFDAQISRNILLGLIHKIMHRHNMERQYKYANIQLFWANPQFQTVQPLKYLAVMRNYMNLEVYQRQFEKLEYLLKEVDQFITANPSMGAQLIHFYYIELQWYFYSGDFDKIIELNAPKIQKHLKSFDIERTRIAGLTHLFTAIAHTLAGDYSGASKFLGQVQALQDILEKDLMEICTITEWINHCESGEHDFLLLHMKSNQRKYFKKHEEKSGFFYAFYFFLKRCLEDPRSLKEEAQKLLDQEDDYRTDPTFQNFIDLSLIIWLEAQAKGKEFRELFNLKRT